MEHSTLPDTKRLDSVDANRGLVMFLMLAEVWRLPKIAKELPQSDFWQFLGFHQSHVEWIGCSLHDLIQPSFSFLVACLVVTLSLWTIQAVDSFRWPKESSRLMMGQAAFEPSEA